MCARRLKTSFFFGCGRPDGDTHSRGEFEVWGRGIIDKLRMRLAYMAAWISTAPWRRKDSSGVRRLRNRRAMSTQRESKALFTSEHRSLLPFIEEASWERLERAANAHLEWNAKINVISRKGFDAETLVERHYLPSLALLRVPGLLERWSAGVRILDLGCGGGFPGLPLAIACPGAAVTLADARRKKIMVVNECAQAADCSNAQGIHARIPDEIIDAQFDFILGRSVAALPDFVQTAKPVLAYSENRVPGLLNGILYIKGGDLSDEIAQLGSHPALDLSISSDLLSPTATAEGNPKNIGEDKRLLYFPASTILKKDTKQNAGRLYRGGKIKR